MLRVEVYARALCASQNVKSNAQVLNLCTKLFSFLKAWQFSAKSQSALRSSTFEIC
jgi:hypothetical protein